jgi:uncharacterized protein YkwD
MFTKPILIALVLTLASPALSCTRPAGSATMAAEVIARINTERHRAGLAPVTAEARLTRAAQDHACDSADRGRMGHQSSDGSDLQDRLKRHGYAFRTAAENVAQGHPSPRAVVAGWMASKGHRRNILTKGITDAGLGLAVDAGRDLHWVLNLGAARN